MSLIILIFCLLLGPVLIQKMNIQPVKCAPDIYQGDLNLTGNNVTTIEGRFDINGSITIEGNATLILNDAILNFTPGGYSFSLQNPLNGTPRLKATNTSIIGAISCRQYDNGSLTFSNCSISSALYLYDETNAEIYDLQTPRLISVRENSSALIVNSTIGKLALVMYSANSSINSLSPGPFDYWSFWDNCSVVIDVGGSAPNVTLIQTDVQEWEISLQASSYSEIDSSTLQKIHTNYGHAIGTNSIISEIELYYTSIVTLTNCTYDATNLYNDAKINVYWILDVHVIDLFNQDVPNANVSVTFSNTSIAGSQLTGMDGWAKLTLMEKVKNATGDYPVGAYTVEATYSIHSNSTHVDMTGNQQVDLKLTGFVIPEFTSLIVPSFIAIATLLGAIFNKRRLIKT
ncbi:MAG: hypothetical protein JSV35_03320 [Candidatus Bathyarchaeota archaeon]|nr:MAG: hypothetical protein JSV35_03320 [Candidatus Bathyarchaeota archaeon]